MTNKYKAPWDLKGSGYIILYKFKKDFVNKEGRVLDYLKDKFIGGFGTVMLVDYEESNAGPYNELLFIPGKFKFKGKKLDTISKIYVSSIESVENGRANWGIPKELASFERKKEGNIETIDIKSDKDIATFKIKSHKLSFPVDTKLMPFPLVEEYEGKYYYTNFTGKGKGHFASIKSIKINKEMFPDISKCKPIIAIKVEPFNITFPVAKIENK